MKITIDVLLKLQTAIEIIEESIPKECRVGQYIVNRVDLNFLVNNLNDMMTKAVWEVVYNGNITEKIEKFFDLSLREICEKYPKEYDRLVRIFGKAIPTKELVKHYDVSCEE